LLLGESRWRFEGSIYRSPFDGLKANGIGRADWVWRVWGKREAGSAAFEGLFGHTPFDRLRADRMGRTG